jgi:apolipoprotein N-acyltransferase
MKILLIQFLHGILLTLAFHPFDIFLVIPISFGGLLYFLEKELLKNMSITHHALGKIGFLHIWIFFLGHFISSFYWLAIPLLAQVKNYWYLIPFAILVLPAFLASFYGFIGYFIIKKFLVNFLQKDTLTNNFTLRTKIALSFAIGFFIAEILRSLLTNFPWNLLGYASNYSLSLMQMASVTGIYGLSLLLYLIGCLTYSRNIPLISLIIIITSLITITGNRRLYYSYNLDNKKKFLSLFLLQPNLPHHNFDPTKQSEDFDKLIAMIDKLPLKDKLDKIQNKTKLVIIPEGVMPFPIEKTELFFLNNLMQEINNKNLLLVTGVDRIANNNLYYNSMILVNDQGEIVDDYDKITLVPFGEYIPGSDFIKPIASVNGFTAGRSKVNIKIFPKNNGESISFIPLICFESIFTPLIKPRPTDKVDFILNLTNDSWFGYSIGPYQHFAMSRMRAIEYGLPLIRASKNGVSAIINSYGKIINQIPLNQEGILIGDLPEDKISTFYMKLLSQ